MRILIACEESQAVCIEFRKLGFEAYSCDILPCSGGHPEWHIQGDILDVIDTSIRRIFYLQNGKSFCISEWDMMCAFPPCTHLAVSGAAWFEQKRKDGRQQEGIDFFMAMVNAPIEKIAIENPIGIMSKLYRKPDQVIHPYHFGDPYQKSTCLWLKNLPTLVATHIDAPLFGETVDKGEMHIGKRKDGSEYKMAKWYNDARSGDHGHKRSKTFPGIAKQMAEQWSKYICK
jgi:hypothetical protein